MTSHFLIMCNMVASRCCSSLTAVLFLG